MKKLSYFLFLLSVSLITVSCFEDRDDVQYTSSTLDIQDFIYRGMNQYYLYKNDIPTLADDYFASKSERNAYLKTFTSPEALFSNLLSEQDRFSFLTSDYTVLENALQGNTLSNGMEYGLVKEDNSSNVFGYVRYVLPNTSSAQQNVERGMIFNRINGTQLTENNYQDLLAPSQYTIGLATFDGENITPLEEELSLTKSEYAENPVYIVKTIPVDDKRIGYIMYNGFTSNYDASLNSAMAELKGEGITDLVIDLRYNGGGSIETCNDLCSMITGQFNGELFITQVYNDNFNDEERFFNNKISTGATINNLNLTKVYVLTTHSTASASELLLSALRPYIDVIQIGDTTIGKFQGSVTLYDSPTFSKVNVNLGHKYAMQPLILKSVNANGFTDYVNGISPDIELKEDFSNLGQLGNVNEPLLQAAINAITTSGRPFPTETNPQRNKLTEIGESKMFSPDYQRMYVDKP